MATAQDAAAGVTIPGARSLDESRRAVTELRAAAVAWSQSELVDHRRKWR